MALASEVKAQPDHELGTWRGWNINCEGHPTGLASVLVQCPRVHAFWDLWVLSLVHLRPVEGQDDAKPAFPGAEFEILFGALDPDKEHSPDADPPTFHIMRPIDLAVQFGGVTDAQALQIFKMVVGKMFEQGVPPDSDYRRFWTQDIQVLTRNMGGIIA